MAENKEQQQPSTISARDAVADAQAGAPLNVVSEHTGQFDIRFLLWRTFCAETGTPVEKLPSELEGELRERWDKMKDNQLHQPTEESPTPPVTNKT